MSSTTELPVHRGPRRSPSHQQPRAASRHGGRGPRAWWRRRSRPFRWLVLGSFVFFVLLCSAAVGVVYAATKIPLPARVDSAQTSFITYADGTSEIVKLGSVNRTDVRLRAVSADAHNAVLAAEDRNFYHEPGISWRGIARALWANVRGREITQGGSTITQQY
ncbi:MAG TPA: transglycosylase domain-containing protein, partial [Frankiaceae bacterium]|nr:transglycosylase domain-containing protein [Frankiaceae bacterium]